MDAIEFTKVHIDELKARLANSKNKLDEENYGKSEEQIVKKFFEDQGMNFGTVNLKDVLSLVKE